MFSNKIKDNQKIVRWMITDEFTENMIQEWCICWNQTCQSSNEMNQDTISYLKYEYIDNFYQNFCQWDMLGVIQILSTHKNNNGSENEIQWCAKKNDTVCKKKTPVQKNEPWRKNLICKKFIFFVNKLNMIDFNIFNILKYIFTCESVAYLLQNSFVNVRFQLNSIFFACLPLWLSLWRLVSSLSALFCAVSSRHSFLLSSLR